MTLFHTLLVTLLSFTVSFSWPHQNCDRFDYLLKPCWSADSHIKCNWCTYECLPDMKAFMQANATEFNPPANCCKHECGSYKITPNLAIEGESFTCCVACLLMLIHSFFNNPVAGKKCNLQPEPRVGCPPINEQAKCHSCEDTCDLKTLCGDGSICCQTQCGLRCVEPILYS